MIYTDDHPPAHVHVFHGGNEAIIEFEGPTIRVRDSGRFNNRDLGVAKLLVVDNVVTLMIEWRKIHG